MHSIDVSDLPEPIARALAEQAEFLRKQLTRKNNGGGRQRIQFAEKLGTVIGDLSREEIYEDDDA